jgi:hypothetical protein
MGYWTYSDPSLLLLQPLELILLYQMIVFVSEGILFREVKVKKAGAGVDSDRKSQLMWGLIFDMLPTFCFPETKAWMWCVVRLVVSGHKKHYRILSRTNHNWIYIGWSSTSCRGLYEVESVSCFVGHLAAYQSDCERCSREFRMFVFSAYP